MNWFEGNKDEVLIIGEVAQAHDGSLGAAHAYICLLYTSDAADEL